MNLGLIDPAANPFSTAPLDVAPEVRAALAAGRAVVALESTIISHGMPYPQNVATALQVEGEVRAHGYWGLDIGVRSQLITLGPNAGGAGALRRLCGRCVGQGPQRAVQRAGGGLVVKERDSVHSQAAKSIWKEASG